MTVYLTVFTWPPAREYRHMLTDKAVKAAKPKPGNQYRKLADQGGLYLFCTTDGTRSWRYDYRLAGKRKTFTVGLYPEVTLAEAREHHSDARKLVAAGQCPVVIKRRKRHAATLGAVNTVKAIAEAWYAELAPHKSESWRYGTRGRLDQYIYPALGNDPITDVDAADVLALVKSIAVKFPKTAEYVRQILTRVFSFAIRNLRTKTNPAREIQGVVMVPEAIHHKPIAAKDIPAFIEKIDGYAGRAHTKLAAKLLLLTMVRKRELTEATWDEIDFDNALWTIPAERMKRRMGHVVPLSKQALEALQELEPMACGSRYVFPNFGNPRKPMSPATINLMFDRLKLDVSPHSLRATASTVLNEANLFRSDAIERQMSHIERNRIRAAYNAAEYMDERRQMMQWWADFIDRPANVVQIKKRA
jgi:integrase